MAPGGFTDKKLGSKRRPPLRDDKNKAGPITSYREGEEEEHQPAGLPVSTTGFDSSTPNLTCLDCVRPQPILTTLSKTPPFRLQLTEPLHLRNSNFHLVTVCRERPGNWEQIGCLTPTEWLLPQPGSSCCQQPSGPSLHLWTIGSSLSPRPMSGGHSHESSARNIYASTLCQQRTQRRCALWGIPLPPNELPSPFNTSLSALMPKKIDSPIDPKGAWRDGIKGLAPLDSEPLKFDLLGSANASFCFQFVFSPVPGDKRFESVRQFKREYTASQWCSIVAQIYTPSTFGGKPLSLPQAIFLICGDRVWAGIPSRLIGGPCTLGQLTLFTPNITQINNWKAKNVTLNSARSKRDLKDLDPECDSKIIHWSKPKGVAITVFLPWVSTAKALGELAHLECWVAKQANFTSAVLSDLLSDEEITRKATLQSRH
ncbi:uncharacterized protein LOC118701561 isoform X1 [Molothrus ater]|uniref:uncharacterized protein LOC118701561 isoform X1 n=1 Tax=Molothrus ater TaxID=84834 RepID=UPI00174879D6|nr:uncharacterized protein LOC118701561 isoform X1 [Molothrus ater]